MNRGTELIPLERIQHTILLIHGEKVMLDSDLAILYGIETRSLIQAMRRNAERFLDDFAFQLTPEELTKLRSQIVTSSSAHGGRRYLPYVFTEQGVAMLSSVIRSKRAVQVNVAIMRAFVTLRRMIATNDRLAHKLAELERQIESHDEAINRCSTPSVN